jgi:hypothetical protein
MSARGETAAVKIARLEATVHAQSIEIRDLKAAFATASEANSVALTALAQELKNLTLQTQPALLAHAKLLELIAESEREKGMVALGKMVVGGGAFSVIGAALYGIWEFFAKGGGS